MFLATLRSVLAQLFQRLNRRLTDGAYQHGRYCVSDGKIRRRSHA
ncbi:hypothetical protein [Ancylobacter defluvii]|uniref:Uncharacterized protein n=1 Tax=Ancylobacter defluvii TaxID=1282440 RepID=A0A9W6NAE9_9HYPH|nr:hypothetical protein [Ancylobacter defluvii]GLK83578.1 hypothetical protein GCM10017653_16470 [Ancylobacter defluvii]